MAGARAARHVLIVEDEPQVRATIREALEYEGYAVSEARHGAEALDLLERTRPDVIVLDLWMPVMDGWEFRRVQLRDHPGIPLVVLSARDRSDVRLDELRADAIVAKPFELDTLYAALAGAIGPP